jgi:hypothetical protein
MMRALQVAAGGAVMAGFLGCARVTPHTDLIAACESGRVATVSNAPRGDFEVIFVRTGGLRTNLGTIGRGVTAVFDLPDDPGGAVTVETPRKWVASDTSQTPADNRAVQRVRVRVQCADAL